MGLDQRLGGITDLATVHLSVPDGFTADPVAAGLTAPVSVAVAPDGLLYLAEAGHPRRTPPRLLRVDPDTGVASVIAGFETLAAPALLTVAHSGETLYVASAETIWRLDAGGAILAKAAARHRQEVPAGSGAFGGACAGAAVWREALYLCDPGSPAGAPGAGLLWRVAPIDWSANIAAAPLPPVRTGHRRPKLRSLAAAASVAVAALALAWWYRERRAARRTHPAT